MSEKKKSSGALLGAAFLMATSAIGPGFLTQTATFTGQYKASFGFVILVSIILSAVAQLNIWRVLCTTGLRGQDVANKVLPGLGYFVSFMVVLGGLGSITGSIAGAFVVTFISAALASWPASSLTSAMSAAVRWA